MTSQPGHWTSGPSKQKVALTIIRIWLATAPRHIRPDWSCPGRAEDSGKGGMERNAFVAVAPDKRTKVRAFEPAIGDIECADRGVDANAARPYEHVNDGLNGFGHMNLACDYLTQF